MTTLRWRDASAAAAGLTPGDRRLLTLLARLPLLPVAALARLLGLCGGASAYRRLAGLRESGLVAAATPALVAGRSPALWHPTDLGLAALALAEGVEPGALARRSGLWEGDPRALGDGLTGLLALYELVAALAAARPGRPELVAWARPWRATFPRPGAKSDGYVRLPAAGALRWGDERRAFLLLPDPGTAPLRAFRRQVGQLVAYHASRGAAALPPLLVATVGRRRADAWAALLDEVATARREAGPAARVVTWERLRADPTILLEEMACMAAMLPSGRWRELPPLRPRSPGRPLPRLPGAGLPASVLAPAEWALLDLLGRHPFLPSDRLHAALGASPEEARRRRNRLIALGLARQVGRGEVGVEFARRELLELTATGLARVAVRQGLTLAEAVRHTGLAGGGPASPIGNRRQLLATPAHTLGADEVFLGLQRACRRAATGTALVEWRNAAACARGLVRPDGYGLLRRGGRLFGFFLEYDRGTMRHRDYARKFAAYHRYRERGLYARDYEGFPALLVVTIPAAEGRIAGAVRDAAIGRGPPLPVLLTTGARLEREPLGMLGPVWRTATDDGLRHWP
ncbi:MAG TPA: replication-relaxation family protein [Thermomicrobiales bacterium]|nr:replication-relaxation family protein [Thermomicrobiales bacterium]